MIYPWHDSFGNQRSVSSSQSGSLLARLAENLASMVEAVKAMPANLPSVKLPIACVPSNHHSVDGMLFLPPPARIGEFWMGGIGLPSCLLVIPSMYFLACTSH